MAEDLAGSGESKGGGQEHGTTGDDVEEKEGAREAEGDASMEMDPEWVLVDDGSGVDVHYFHLGRGQKTRLKPAMYTPALCDDGTPRYAYRGRCVECKLPLAAELRSAHGGGIVFSYNVCQRCMQNAIGGRKPIQWQSPRVGDSILDGLPDKPKNLCLSLEKRQLEAANNDTVQVQRALDAKLSLYRAAKARRDKARELQLLVRAEKEYGVRSGTYLSWGFLDKYDEYIGAVQDGKPHGFGVKVYSDGSEYVGEFMLGVHHSLETPATFRRADGRKYEGTFQNGKKHGQGRSTWPDGSAYSGQYAQGMEHGHGTKTYADGSVFEGRFRYGRRDGQGVLTHPDGTREKGVFRDTAVVHEDEPPLIVQDIPRTAPFGQPSDLLSLAQQQLGRYIVRYPDLYTPMQLYHLVPEHMKADVAHGLLHANKQLGRSFRERAMQLAWKDPPAVDLVGVRLGTEDTAQLILFQEPNFTLTTLRLVAAHLNSATAMQLAVFCSSRPILKHLDLSWNTFGLDGTAILAPALMKCHALETLGLAGVGLGGDGATVFCDAIRDHPTLVDVNISFNNLGVPGADAIAELLRHTTVLRRLELRGNHMGPDGGRTVADALLHGTRCLDYIGFADNHVGGEVASLIAACQTAKTPEVLRGFSAGSAAETRPR